MVNVWTNKVITFLSFSGKVRILLSNETGKIYFKYFQTFEYPIKFSGKAPKDIELEKNKIKGQRHMIYSLYSSYIRSSCKMFNYKMFSSEFSILYHNSYIRILRHWSFLILHCNHLCFRIKVLLCCFFF